MSVLLLIGLIFANLGYTEPLPPPRPPAPPSGTCDLPTPGYADGENASAQIQRIEKLFNDGSAALQDVRREVVGWRSGRCYHSDSDRADGALLVGDADADGMATSAVAILLAGDARGFDFPDARVQQAVRDYLSQISVEVLASSPTSMKFRLGSADGTAGPRDSIVKEVRCGAGKYFLMHFRMETMDEPATRPTFWCYFNDWRN